MKTVKEYKSLPVNEISESISADIDQMIEDRIRTIEIQLGYIGPHEKTVPYNQYGRITARAHAYALGKVESLLVTALMELAHKQSTPV